MKNVIVRGMLFCASFFLTVALASQPASAQMRESYLPPDFFYSMDFSTLMDGECAAPFSVMDLNADGDIAYMEAVFFDPEYITYPEQFYAYDMDWNGVWNAWEFHTAYPECDGM